MIKKISIILMCLLLAATAFSACSKKDKNAENTDESTSEGAGLDDVANEYGFEEDADGDTVPVVYEDGKAYVIDEQGNKTGEVIKNPKNAPSKSGKSGKSGNNGSGDNGGGNGGSSESPTRVTERESVTNRTETEKATTKSELTTLPLDKDVVPATSATGTAVQFSDSDVTTLTNMLEIPYLYLANYENSDRVPIEIATHTACWMAQRQNIDTNTFAGGTVAVDLFCYYARTVVNFKAQCNNYTGSSADNAAPITYDSANDTFTITASSYESPTHRVEITSIEDLGNNNYYKVTANVSGIDSSCNKKKVVAIIQKNKLDMSLGFSVKALKWS